MLQILPALSHQWAAKMALHHRLGSKKLIKHFRPPKLGLNTIPTIEEAEANYVVERQGALKPDAALRVLHHITEFATKRFFCCP
jgi:hypothetical protein